MTAFPFPECNSHIAASGIQLVWAKGVRKEKHKKLGRHSPFVWLILQCELKKLYLAMVFARVYQKLGLCIWYWDGVYGNFNQPTLQGGAQNILDP